MYAPRLAASGGKLAPCGPISREEPICQGGGTEVPMKLGNAIHHVAYQCFTAWVHVGVGLLPDGRQIAIQGFM